MMSGKRPFDCRVGMTHWCREHSFATPGSQHTLLWVCDREYAYRAVRYPVSNGRSDLDVGIMQVNRNL
jgi:hypothetical protein